NGTMKTLVEHHAIADVFLSPAPVVGSASADPVAGASNRTLRITYRDGSRLTGTLTRIEDTHLTLTCPGVKEPLRLPLAELRSLIVLRHTEATTVPAVAGKPGRLEMEGISLKGRLVDGSEQPDASCLVWHPDLGLTASPLRHGLSGRIVYRDPPPLPKPNAVQARRAALINQDVARVNPDLARVIVRVTEGGNPAAPPLP